ncbi:hypothetical protein MNBD_GAMMA15-635 [hydrothermal vent metagenome]|uniref:Phosphotyrosine protein phosphatase I domain-containing protein n=1 Tax=hydrothermal vent metagenome TaxID=652676 RepID=A0A3B0Y8R5_9ZZZZ
MLLRICKALLLRLRHARILLFARRISLKRLDGIRHGNILVLCYGNIYRSPFVEQRFRVHLDERWMLRSAGFHKKTGRPCDPDYIPIAARYGGELTNHRSRCVNHEDIEWADLIIIMDRKNYDQLEFSYPDALDKVVWVAAALDVRIPEVEDPYGKPQEQIEKLVRRMDDSVAAISALLKVG